MPKRRYSKRYWIDGNGQWRDRHNHNRASTGPKRDVDRRSYRPGTATPDTWKTKTRAILFPDEAPPPRRKPPRFKDRAPTDAAPRAFPPVSLFSSPFRSFLELLPTGAPRTNVTMYAIVKRTDAKYVTASNASGARIFAKQIGTMTRGQAAKLTVADVRELVSFDPDGLLAVLPLKGRAVIAKGIDPIRSAIGTSPKMWRYLRWLDTKTGIKPPTLKTRAGRVRKMKPGGGGKRMRFTASR